jgi:hypothetical protein
MKIKPLSKPIIILVSIRIRTWYDKYYGNTYASARVTVNNDYDNELVYPMSYTTASNLEAAIMNDLCSRYKRIALAKSAGYQYAAHGIHISKHVEDGLKRDCVHFGKS